MNTAEPWFLKNAQLGSPRPWDRDAVEALPELSRLLAAAMVAPVRLRDEPYELVTWGPPDEQRGWLCHPPAESPPDDLHPTHRQLLPVFGGIHEMFGAPECWWGPNNLDILSLKAASMDLGETFDAYAWAWEDENLEIPINVADHYVAGCESNGNLVLAHRRDDQVLLFAPDHAFDNVTQMDGCPPQSLYTIDATATFVAWVELNARAWAAAGQ